MSTKEHNVLADSHESKPRINAAKKRWNTVVKQLDVGDYICDGKVVVEYKTMPDFLSSMRDGRLKRESINQLAFPYHYIVVVGDVDTTIKSLRYKNIYYTKAEYNGALSSLLTYTKVIPASNMNHAFNLMGMVFDKCLDNKDRTIPSHPKPSSNPCFNFLAFIPGIAEERAKLITEELELNTAQDLFTVTKEDLMGVSGIKEKLADKIMKRL